MQIYKAINGSDRSMNTFVEKISQLKILSPEELANKLDNYCNNNNSSEKESWKKSLPKLINVISDAGFDNLYLAAEYSLAAGERIDAVLLGDGLDGKHKALIVELKQWSSDRIEYRDDLGFPSILVKANPDYRTRHPSVQTADYLHQLKRNHDNVKNGELNIYSCEYLHDFDASSKSFFNQGMYENIDISHMFCMGEEKRLQDYIRELFDSNADSEIAKDLLINGEFVMSELDMEVITKITNDPESIQLLNDQPRIAENVLQLLRQQAEGRLSNDKKYMFLVSGAAGTGKTIVGFKILADYFELHRNESSNFRCQYSMPRSRTILQVLNGINGYGQGIQPVYFDKISKNLDLLVIDEAHRITVNDDIERVINSAQIVVVLQDDNQRVLCNEIGTIDFYKLIAYRNRYAFLYHPLNIQKRSGFGSYVDRIDKLLYDKDYETDDGLGISVNVVDNLRELEENIDKLHETTNSVKYYAPFYWPWQSVKTGYEHYMDITIPDNGYVFEKQWNPLNHQYEWYINSIERVGCIYTAQGLGFDYVGLLWMDDLVWRTDHWEYNINKITNNDTNMLKKSLSNFEYDKRSFEKKYNYLLDDLEKKKINVYLKEPEKVLLNIYRVLLTRAKKGIFIWFKDEETKKHFIDMVF